jgi:hypothetical protein
LRSSPLDRSQYQFKVRGPRNLSFTVLGQPSFSTLWLVEVHCEPSRTEAGLKGEVFLVGDGWVKNLKAEMRFRWLEK